MCLCVPTPTRAKYFEMKNRMGQSMGSRLQKQKGRKKWSKKHNEWFIRNIGARLMGFGWPCV